MADNDTNNTKELNDEELQQIAGGDRSRRILSIELPQCGEVRPNYEFCPYKDDYTKCPDKGVIVGCDIESRL